MYFPNRKTVAKKAAFLLCVIFVFSMVGITGEKALNDNLVLPQQSTTGPVPPAGIDLIGHVFSGFRIQAATVISGVPPYLWRHGCGPTAVGMVTGYYDSHGYPNLISGSAFPQGNAVNAAIASDENYNDYCLPLDSYPNLLPDKSELPVGDEHADNCIADFQKTSQSYLGNYYGWSWNTYVEPSFEDYVTLVSSYTGNSTIYDFSGFSWNSLKNEIDSKRPMVFLVDTDGDDKTDHFITVIGYNSDGGINYYGCYDTWDSSVHWYQYRGMASGNAWGVCSVNTFAMSPLQGKDDFVGTWDGQGVYYRNSDTGTFVAMASPATMIACGDLYGDGLDDLIGVWPAQSGVWVKNSSNGSWIKISYASAKHIASGDMNGDGEADFVGTWDGYGVQYRNSASGVWVTLATPATMITAGDLDGDGKDDLIGIWPAQGGVWVKYSATGSWAKLSSTAKDIAAGDMNGDGRDDLLATWDGQGVYFRNSMNGLWVKTATPADQVTCGDLDADGKADLIGIWPSQGGVWVKYSTTGSWAKLSSSARDIAAGKMRAGTGGSMLSQALFGPMGGYAQGPESLIHYQDISSEGPGGLHFVYQTEEQLMPQEQESEMMRIPGPGEPGFRCVEEKNLFPLETKKRR